MPREVLKVSIAQEDGAPPAALSAGIVLGGGRGSELSACFIGTTRRWPPSSRHDRLGNAGMFKTAILLRPGRSAVGAQPCGRNER